MADPKGILDPGISTGSKNGAVKIIHDMKRPRSPIISRKASKVMPSAGILEEISDITIENFSLSSTPIDIINNLKIINMDKHLLFHKKMYFM
jgi:predicted transcriptional regulator